MQSLNISASALRTVQAALDNTANNLANVDTIGYKRREASFSELLADNMREQPATDTQRNSPAGLRIGRGVKIGTTKLDLSQGSAKTTDVPTDLMIQGKGYFMVTHRTTDQNGVFLQEEFRLTRDGSFKLSPNEATGTFFLTTANGDILVDENGLPVEVASNDFKVTEDGHIFVNGEDTLTRIPVWQVDNPEQYTQIGQNEYALVLQPGEQPGMLFQESTATIRQGALEASNVDVSAEMTNLITTQRAYQLNSRAIAITDQMMGIANQLRSR
ncbi:flagellar hook-basal body protein [Brevibacillus fulvus]|uniref:Flagellar basal-body rod protein FlgG n=1 Tax=Brevibacillus fulvus TaxID=1125967 RepID=A0A938XYV9_9BACL|nr:flagellar hook-basal body protein [Brevibacillus fulvus]MBM7590158.1 flagellar basal-body rod protein FlgG [Brevibacillus fulvus]